MNNNMTVSYNCKNYSSVKKPMAKRIMNATINQELLEGIVSVVDSRPTCVHALGAVDKDHGESVRCITDASRPSHNCINLYMDDVVEKFSFVAVKDVVKEMTQNCYMSILDVQSAYRNVPVLGKHRTYQGFRWEVDNVNRYLVSNSLTFGIKCAPYIFPMHTEFIVRCMKRRGHERLFGYLDDLLMMSDSYEGCVRMMYDLLFLLRDLGFKINYKKLITPRQKIRYLGIELEEDKLTKLNLLIDEFLKLDKCSKKCLQQLVGVLAHCSTIVRGGRTFSRRAINLLKLGHKQSDIIHLSEVFKADLLWWKHFSMMFNGSAAIISVQFWNCITMYADASMLGFGSCFNNDWTYGTWDNDTVAEFNHEEHFVLGPIELLCSSAERELWPILISMIRWGKDWSGKAIHVFTDNSAVQIMLCTGRSKNILCMQWLREIFWGSFVYNFEIFVHRISSEQNVFCDALSRVKGRKYSDLLYDYVSNREFCCLSCRG